jgi:hypothetical protein
VNTKNKKRETPLMLARTREIAVILLGVGADPMCVSSGVYIYICMYAFMHVCAHEYTYTYMYVYT